MAQVYMGMWDMLCIIFWLTLLFYHDARDNQLWTVLHVGGEQTLFDNDDTDKLGDANSHGNVKGDSQRRKLARDQSLAPVIQPEPAHAGVGHKGKHPRTHAG